MQQIKAALFDFDGVLADTEPLYDQFWDDAGIRYHTGIPHFAAVIKGTTMSNVMKKYFSDRPEEEQRKIQAESDEFESRMPFPPVPGSLEFVRMLKAHGVQVGLVTSSENRKMKRAFQEMNLEGLFDTFVSENRITRGKPDPMCYLLAAEDLKRKPEECIVFEDSFSGVEAAHNGGMKAVGVGDEPPHYPCFTQRCGSIFGSPYQLHGAFDEGHHSFEVFVDYFYKDAAHHAVYGVIVGRACRAAHFFQTLLGFLFP